jgi:hypothetical protein
MLKKTLTMTALATVLAVPAFAADSTSTSQSTPSTMQPAPQTMPATTGANTATNQMGTFEQQQGPNDWRSSKLVGTNVYGTGDVKIGDINDVLIGSSGQVKAVVVGVGGFLGVGEKNVAIPFDALQIQRKPNSATIDKITVSYSKEDLKNAPKFAWYQASEPTQTTGSGSMSKGMAPSTTTAPSTNMNNDTMKK